VSIYVPSVSEKPEERGTGRIHLKNLVADAQEQLEEAGWRAPDAEKLLAPAAEQAENADFWSLDLEGAVFFMAPEFSRALRLPFTVEPRLMVAPRFHIRPLLPYVTENSPYYILALSQENTRLIAANRYDATEMDLGDAPTSLAEALAYDDPERRLQHHTSEVSISADQGRDMFHAHDPDEDEKANLRRFFQQLDERLDDYLTVEDAPLVLVGVEYLHPIFRSVTAHDMILEEGVNGNPDHLDADELQEQTWPLVEEYLETMKRDAMERYVTLGGTERTKEDMTEVLPAAYYGQVETLFVPRTGRQWADFDPTLGQVTLHDEPDDGQVELYDLAAIETLLNSGTVYTTDEDDESQVPAFAAILRYAITEESA
jgi:hypothetical protein